jgi:glycosyltransferase involved in cell wall biosynthesis
VTPAKASDLERDGVVMVTNAVAPDQLGGLQRYVRELAGAIARKGIPVAVVAKAPASSPGSDTYESDGVRVIRFSVPDRTDPSYAIRYPVASTVGVIRALRSVSGLPHVHYPLQGFPVGLGRRDFVHTFHAPIYKEIAPERSYRLPNQLVRPLRSTARTAEAFVARRATGTIVLTEYMRGELLRLAPRSAARALVVPTGLDTDFFAPGPQHDHPFANAPGPLLFTARRFVPRTGVTQLVEAMKEILSQMPDARLAIAGDGQLWDEVHATIVRNGLSDSVLLLGRISDEDLVRWYRASTLFVLPTQELEGFGISTVEALACGTPAIGTPVGGTPEVLGSLDGRLVSTGVTPRALAQAALSVLLDPELLDSIRKRARGHVVPRMSWPTIADEHLAFYESQLADISRLRNT